MVVGGSLGSVAVNDAVRSVLPELLQSFQVVHLCGKGKVDESLKGLQGYAQFEYIKDELKDLFALTDLVISRAGANAICELLALHKTESSDSTICKCKPWRPDLKCPFFRASGLQCRS